LSINLLRIKSDKILASAWQVNSLILTLKGSRHLALFISGNSSSALTSFTGPAKSLSCHAQTKFERSLPSIAARVFEEHRNCLRFGDDAAVQGHG
jgi:hypothetical protein